MEEIEVGEYIRTNDGIIGKLKRIELDNIDKSLKWYVFTGKIPDKNIIDEVYINKPYIIKHSKNIIDLIEVGDIIEWEYEGFGYYGINEVINRFGTIGVYGIEYDDVIPLKNINIKRILTHEQYENNCYRIGE